MNGPKNDLRINRSNFLNIAELTFYYAKFGNMLDQAKIALSQPELLFIQNTEWILTKQLIIQKVYELMSSQTVIINTAFSQLHGSVDILLKGTIPKIYKGENYLELPYVMMDYPASFGRADIFALRTMFWWGNFVSVTLLISGRFKERYQLAISNNLNNDSKDFFVCVATDPWQHHFGKDNYQPHQSADMDELMKTDFLKVARKFDLQNWNNMPNLLNEAYKSIISLLEH